MSSTSIYAIRMALFKAFRWKRMKPFRGLSWKTSAKVNTGLIMGFSVILLGLLAYGLHTSGINSAFVLYHGPCKSARQFNIALHLVLNVFGTLILASSNFFTQIVVAPSRDELDRAHQKSRWMDIGVPTARNFINLPTFKLCAWLILMASSVPIHLLLNSAIFFIERQRSSFTMTIAAEPFVNGTAYYPPGASLWNMDVPNNCTQPSNLNVATMCSKALNTTVLNEAWDAGGNTIYCYTTEQNRFCIDHPGDDCPKYDPRLCINATLGTGIQGINGTEALAALKSARYLNCTAPANMEDARICADGIVSPLWKQPDHRTVADYLDRSSPVNANLTRAANALSSNWEWLDPATCRSEFLECGQGKGLRDYRDVVVVASEYRAFKQGYPSDGWKRQDLFGKMSSTDASFWEPIVPSKEINPLFYTSTCSMTQSFNKQERTNKNMCRNSCAVHLGYGTAKATLSTEIIASSIGGNDGHWEIPFWDNDARIQDAWKYQMRSGLTADIDYKLAVMYCLAEKMDTAEDGGCKIAASNIILLVMTICVLAKTIQCSLLMWRFVWREDHHPPLITPGDAVDSLLRSPDMTTENMSTLEQADMQYIWSWKWKPVAGEEADTRIGTDQMTVGVLRRPCIRSGHQLLFPSARRWEARPRPYYSAIPMSTWGVSYALFFSVLTVPLVFLVITTNKFKLPFGGFGVNSLAFIMPDQKRQNYSGGFLETVLLANVPQLILSICYIRFNALLTRLHIAKEWAEMCTKYRPLRVTQPRGRQVSSYTLQLPLSWSIPYIILSILLHFFVSNALYVFISDGGFFGTPMSHNQDNTIGLSPDGFIGLGYSAWGIVASIIAFAIVILSPLTIGGKRLPGDAGVGAVVGTNSLAISAACHASSLTKARDLTEKTQYYGANGDGERTPGVEETVRLVTHYTKGNLPSPGRRSDREEEAPYVVGTKTARDCLAESEIKWGVVMMPEEFYDDLVKMDGLDGDESVGHLGFGVEEDRVDTPVDRCLYA